jgi:hypothetical protein
MTEERRSCSSRRDGDICKLHPQMEEKIDKIIENQQSYMGHQVDLAVNVAEIKTIVNNGLKAKMIEATTTIEELKEKIDKLEDFQWFREFVNDMRTSVFKHIMKWALIGGVLVFFLSAFFVGGERFWRLFIK